MSERGRRLSGVPAPLAAAGPPRALHREASRPARRARARPNCCGSRTRTWPRSPRRRSPRRCCAGSTACRRAGCEADLQAAECWACCRHDALYPAALRDAADAPWALIGRGDPALLRGLEPDGAVTVVGARRASSYGREVARELGRELAAAGLVVVSGLAFGIDACAHRGALEAGLTVAVLGCGADVAYPAAHRSLWRRIGERGLVLSELPPGTGAWRWTFPARNRIMAALAGMTVVVEAARALGLADHRRPRGRPRPRPRRRSRPGRLAALGRPEQPARRRRLPRPRRPGRARRDARAGGAADRALRAAAGAASCAVLESLERGEETCDAIAAALDLSRRRGGRRARRPRVARLRHLLAGRRLLADHR